MTEPTHAHRIAAEKHADEINRLLRDESIPAEERARLREELRNIPNAWPEGAESR